MRYQTIRANNRIVNSTSFGRRLCRFLRKPEQRALLPDGIGWRGQGAWILADALVHWSGSRLKIASLRAHDGGMEHIVVAEPAMQLFMDADGVAGQIDLMTKMAVVMRTPNVTIADFVSEDAVKAGVAYDENIAVELAIRLLHKFGPYRPELLSLPEPAMRDATRSSRLVADISNRLGGGRVPCPGGVPAVA
jgi:hypothetical protein